MNRKQMKQAQMKVIIIGSAVGLLIFALVIFAMLQNQAKEKLKVEDPKVALLKQQEREKAKQETKQLQKQLEEQAKRANEQAEKEQEEAEDSKNTQTFDVNIAKLEQEEKQKEDERQAAIQWEVDRRVAEKVAQIEANRSTNIDNTQLITAHNRIAQLEAEVQLLKQTNQLLQQQLQGGQYIPNVDNSGSAGTYLAVPPSE